MRSILHPMTQNQPLQNALLIPHNQIRPSNHNARRIFDEAELAELSATIQEYGLLEPVVVRYAPSRYDATPYELISGERRWRASEGILNALPAIVQETEAGKERELSLIENLQRKDLTAYEEAKGLQNLAAARGVSMEAAARLLGKSPGWARNRSDLLKVKPDVRKVAERTPAAMSSLLEINKVQDAATRRSLLDSIENEIAPVKQIKARVADHLKHEQWKKDSQKAPDAMTAQRAAHVAKTGGISTSRGKIATGNTPAQAFENSLRTFDEIFHKLDTLDHWEPLLTDAKRAQIAQRWHALALRVEAKL